MANCVLPYCFRIEFQKVRCRANIVQGAPVNPPFPKAFETAIMAPYVNFTFDCLGDDCVCELQAPPPWQPTIVAKQGVPWPMGGVNYIIDYVLRFDVRVIWGTCSHPAKKPAGGQKAPLKKGRKKRR
jgi:hypothetical protein